MSLLPAALTLTVAGAVAGAAAAAIALCAMPNPASAAERLQCFSNICPGDPPAILKTVVLSGLSSIAARGGAADLKAALPDTNDADRKLLAGRMDDDGRFLIDQKTLQAFLGIKGVCAPIAPFLALFTSDSGHLTSVEFDVIKVDGEVRFGVKTIRRAFNTLPNTPAYIALIADLSQKFGYKVGAEAPHTGPDGVSTTYEETERGFRLSVSVPGLANRNLDIASQPACEPKTRIKID